MEDNNINDILAIDDSKSLSNIEQKPNKYRYPALRTIADVYMLLAWIIGIVAIITTFYFLTENRMQIFTLVLIIVGGLLALRLAAISESIKVFLDVEYKKSFGEMKTMPITKCSSNKGFGGNSNILPRINFGVV